MKRSTIAKDFEAKQAISTGTFDHSLAAEAPLLATTLSGTTEAPGADWPGSTMTAEFFASKDEVGELRQAVAVKVS